MHRSRIVARTVGLGMFFAGTGALAAQGAPSASLLSLPAPATLSCDQSPFGKAAPMIRDLEPLYVMNTSSDKRFEEWRPSLADETPPLQRVYGTSIEAPALAGKTMRKSLNADLNGDGRDEVVVASSDGNSVILTVYERSLGFAPTAQVIDTWAYTETEDGGGAIDPASIDMVAGDLDGSRDKQQEIAVSWHINSGNHAGDTRVVVLKGDSVGHIAQGDGTTAGSWRAGYASAMPKLAVGDFLLTGRDQLVLVNFAAAAFSINYDLIEFNDAGTGTAALSDPLVGNSLNVRSKHFSNVLKDATFAQPFFADENGNSTYMSATFGVQSLDAHGGDLVDTAAAELVLHLMFTGRDAPFSNPAKYQRVLGQRLLHFDTALDVNNVITNVTLGNPGGGDAGQSYDSSRVVEFYGPLSSTVLRAPPAFAATVADVDGLLGKEIVTVRAGAAPNDNPLVDQGHLIWWAHKVQVRMKPSFQYKNQGTDSNGNDVVAFTNNSHGPAGIRYDWDFGDGTHSVEVNPSHAYTSTGNRSVSLTVTAPAIPNQQGTTTYTHSVPVTGGFDGTVQGDAPPLWTYRIDPNYTYSVEHPSGLYSSQSLVKIGVGDMNRDGLPEVFAVAKDIQGSIHRHVFKRLANGGFGYDTAADAVANVSYLDVLLSDFDGDSLNAVLSTAVGACQTVTDRQMRALVWMPPYFDALQGNGYRVASFGKSVGGTSSIEERSGSYTADSFSATLGIDVEFDAPILAIKIAEVELTSTFSYGLQAEKGKTHGYETGYSIDQGYSMGDNGHTEQEGVMSTEDDTSDCYTYNILTSSGILPNSTLSACELKPGTAGRSQASYGSLEWNTLAQDPASPQQVVVVPKHWIPVQRDWASLAMFHVPAAGSALGRSTVGFSADHGADKATDGLFTTSAESDQTYNKPYLEIDLGAVRDIMAVRVFPTADPQTTAPPFGVQPISFKKAVVDMRGYRLYASATPFISDVATPTSATTTTFVPGGISTFVQDYASESVYSTWNIWTGNPGAYTNDPDISTPLHARYLRLQKPGSGKIRIAEIQVFGGTHAEPPMYPDGVCDEVVGDGLFKAQVYDTVHHVAKTIEVRGDMLWTGAVDAGSQDTGVPGCQNDSTAALGSEQVVPQFPIWQGEAIVGLGNHNWNLEQTSGTSQGSYTSIDHNFNVSTEFKATAGIVVGGFGFEVGGGITQEHSSSMTWDTGFNVGGNMTGFPGHAACTYFPRPYAFKESEFSNIGIEHAMYVTDYVVRQQSGWQRDNVPAECLVVIDSIFAYGFE